MLCNFIRIRIYIASHVAMHSYEVPGHLSIPPHSTLLTQRSVYHTIFSGSTPVTLVNVAEHLSNWVRLSDVTSLTRSIPVSEWLTKGGLLARWHTGKCIQYSMSCRSVHVICCTLCSTRDSHASGEESLLRIESSGDATWGMPSSLYRWCSNQRSLKAPRG